MSEASAAPAQNVPARQQHDKPLRVVVTFDAELARRTQLHKEAHPVKPDDEYFESMGDSGPVAAALRARGHTVSTLGLDRRASPQLESIHPENTDIVFNLCDTVGGDSRLAPIVPAVLEANGVPVVGADQFGLAASKRKHDVKAVLVRENLPTPCYQVVTCVQDLAAFQLTLELPVILKLTAEHSSIGIEPASVCFTPEEVSARATALLTRFKQPVLIEEFVQGREFYVSLFGDPARPLPLMEHTFSALPEGFLNIRTFDVKWFSDATLSQHSAAIDPRWAQAVPYRKPPFSWHGSIDDIDRICARAFDAIGCRDWGRIDIRLDRGGIPMIIDVTPNTYLGPSSPCAKAAAAAGVDYGDFVTSILDGAWQRTLSQSS